MTNDSIKGDVNEVAGKAQSKVGEAFGDRDMEAKGAVRDMAGQAQSIYGDVKDGVSDLTDNVTRIASERLGADNAKAVQDFVQKSPVVSLVLAAAAGFLFATLTSR